MKKFAHTVFNSGLFQGIENKQKFLSLIIVLCLFSFSLSAQIKKITYHDVVDIADRYAKELWDDVSRTEPIPYYGPNEEIIAYHFNYAIDKEFPERKTLMENCNLAFKSGKQKTGWGNDEFANMVIGAQPYMPVFIEYSHCLSKQYARGIELEEAAAKEVGTGYSLEKTYYLGLVDVWFCFKKGDVKKYINLEPFVKVMGESEFREYMDGKTYFWNRDTFEEDWIKFLNNKEPIKSGTVFIPYKELMPFYEWCYGCTPTSGAMHLAWWDNVHHFGKLIDYHMSRWDPVLELTRHHVPWTQKDLASAMGTNSSGSTDVEDICDGYIEVVEDRGYNCSSDSHYAFYWTVEELFDDIKSEINNQRPIHVGIDNHSLVGIGYNNDNKTIHTHDPNLSTVRIITRAMLEATFWVNVTNNTGSFVFLDAPDGGNQWGGNGGDNEVLETFDFFEITWDGNQDPNTYIKLFYHDEGGYALDRWFLITDNTPNDDSYI